MTKQDFYSWYKNDTGQSVSEQAGITITCPECGVEIEDEFSMSEFPYVNWLEKQLEELINKKQKSDATSGLRLNMKKLKGSHS